MKPHAERRGADVVALTLRAETPYDRRTLALLACEFGAYRGSKRGGGVAVRGAGGPSLQLRVKRCLAVLGRPAGPAEIARETGIDRGYVCCCLRRLLGSGEVTVPEWGLYRLAAEKPAAAVPVAPRPKSVSPRPKSVIPSGAKQR